MRRSITLVSAALVFSSAAIALGANDVVIESKSVAPGATGVTVGVYVENDVSLSGLVVPFELRSITAGSYITTSYSFAVTGRVGSSGLMDFPTKKDYNTPAANTCSGPASNTYSTGGAVDYVSPDASMFVGVVTMSPYMEPGNDGEPGVGTPSFLFTFNVTGVDGSFEIDTCCVTPANHLQFVDDFYMPITPSFTKGTVMIGTPPPTNNPPVAQCTTADIGTDFFGCQRAEVDPLLLDDGSFDVDTGDVITYRVTPSGPYPLGDTDVWLVVTDNHGDADSCQTTITVSDIHAPVVTCPGNITVGNDPDACGAVVEWAPATATDNCEVDSVYCDPPSGSLFPIGTTPVTCIAVDVSSNADTCTFNVTVNDTQPLVAVCPADISVGNDPGQCGALVDFTVAASDNCPGATATATPASGSFFDVGATLVEVIATNPGGDADTCTFTVTVEDTQAPVANCPGDIDVTISAGTTDTVITFTSTVDDNCPGATVACDPPSGSVFPVGTTSVCCIAVDVAGNADTCCFSVTVREDVPANNPPVAVCQDITVSADENCSADGSIDDGSYDPDGDPITMIQEPAGPYPLGATIVSLIVTDDKGAADTCQGNVTVVDDTPPTVTCPADITVDNDADQCGATVSWDPATGTDNCTIDVVSCDPASGSFFPVGTTPVMCIAVDLAGEADTCTFNVTVEDTQAPVANCPGDIDVTISAGATDTVITFLSTVDDNCPGATVACDPPSGSVFSVGTTPVCCIAVDAAGNADTCCFSVTVRENVPDNTPPVAVCQDITISADENCSADGSIDNGSYDPDGDPITLVQDPPGPYPVGATTVTLTVTDDKGASGTCEGTVTVIDDTPPVVECPADVVVGNDPGDCGAVVSWDPATPTDNCGIDVTYCDPAPGTFFPIGTTEVMCIAVDLAGEADTCTFNVTVEDTEPPVANCPGDIDVTVSAGTTDTVITFTSTVDDNCPGATVACDPPSGSGFPVGTTPVCCIAVDAAGNADTCCFSVTVREESPVNTPPVAVCQDITLSAGEDCTADGSVDNGSYDPDGDPITLTQDPPGPYPLGTTTVTLTVDDDRGGSATCEAVITVIDDTPPVVECSADTTVGNDVGECGAIVEFQTSASDNCGDYSVSCDPPSGSFFPIGTTMVECAAVDAAGNASSCTFEITVNDTEPPVVQCADDTTITVPEGVSEVVVEFSATADDNCPGVTVACTPPSGSLFPSGTTTVTCVATDASGNTATCDFTVRVVGTGGTRTVAVDIKPMSCPNPVNVKNKGVDNAVIPVAILGTMDFDVTSIDPASVRLEGVPPIRWALEDVTAPLMGAGDVCECDKLGPDGYTDMTLKFTREEIVDAIGPVADGDEVPLMLTGLTFAGTGIEGEDCIVIRLKGKGAKVAMDADRDVSLSNAPNPFNAATIITYDLTEDSRVTLDVFDVLGRRVASLVSETQAAGRYSVPWKGVDDQGHSLASGMYFYRLVAGDVAVTKKMVLLK